MKALMIEMLKFKNKRALFALIILPLLVLCALLNYNLTHTINHRKSEGKLVSLLSLDLGTQADYWDKVRGRYGPYDPNTETTLNALQQENYQYFTQGESARFNYSVSVFHEDWQKANAYKQIVFQNLQQLLNNGESLFSLEQKDVEETLPVIDWLLINQVDHIDETHSVQSIFLLLKSMPLLLGIFAIATLCLLFGELIFRDLHTSQMKLMRMLPLSYGQINMGKNMLFLIALVVYLCSVALITFTFHVLFDTLPLGGQLTYPLTYFSQGTLYNMPMWQFMVYYAIYFIVLSFVLCYATVLINRKVNNYMLSLSITTFTIISINLSDILWGNFAEYNLFKVFQIGEFLRQNNSRTILLTGGILLLIATALFFINSRWQPKKAKDKPSQMREYHHLSLWQFEWLKIKKFNTWVYALIVVLLLTSYQTTIMLQELTSNQQKVQKQLETHIDLYKKDLAQFDSDYAEENPEYKRINQEIEQLTKRLERALQAIQKGDYTLVGEMELESLEATFEYERAEETLFIPNAHINYQLAQWKKEKGIAYVPPGGPYMTEYVPAFEDINKFHEDAAFSGMSRQEYDHYIHALNEKHDYLSGINNAHYFITSYNFLILLAIVTLFFSTSYAEEWSKDNPTIHLLIAQPISLKQIFSIKRNLAMLHLVGVVCVTALILIALGTVLNGIGQVDFPVVQYVGNGVGDFLEREAFIKIPYLNAFYRILPIWKMIGWGYLLLIALMLFVNQFIFLLSAVIRKKWTVMLSAVLIIVGGYLISTLLPNDWQPYVPFVYLDLPNVLNGRLSLMLNAVQLNARTGIGVQLVGIGILKSIEWIYFRRRNRS